MKESLIEAKIIDYGKLRDIHKDIIYYKLYIESLRKSGVKEKVIPPPNIPKPIISSMMSGGIPRDGPLQLDIIRKNVFKIKGYNALIESKEINEMPLYAVVEYRDDGIKVYLAYREKPIIAGIDLGIRHLITIVGLKENKLWKVRFFDEPKLMEYFLNYLGDEQGVVMLEEFKNKSRKIVYEAVNFIENLEPNIVALEDLNSFETKAGKGLRALQSMLESELRKRGIKYRKVDPYNTSKICSKCGYKKGEVMGSIFVCPSCGYKADRDFNAAFNIALKCYYTC